MTAAESETAQARLPQTIQASEVVVADGDASRNNGDDNNTSSPHRVDAVLATETPGNTDTVMDTTAPAVASFFQLFRYADRRDMTCMIIGSVAAVAYG